MCVLLLKLSALHVCGKSIEVGIKRKRVDLRMNALLEPKLLHPRKTMNCLQPSLITSQESPSDSIYVFVIVCHEMKCKS